jgi:hypothetical protein
LTSPTLQTRNNKTTPQRSPREGCLRDARCHICARVYPLLPALPAVMSGRNPYAISNGYSITNAPAGRYGDLYTQDNNSSTSSINGYGSRERRPGGYGGLGADPDNESPQPPTNRIRPGIGEDSGYGRRPRRDETEREYSESSRSRDRAAPRTNGGHTPAASSSRRGQRSMEGESTQHCRIGPHRYMLAIAADSLPY